MSAVELSVVIPTYNRRELVREMLIALSRQSLSSEKFEVVVVVDGSSDGTREMLKDLDTPYSLRVSHQAQSGAAAARNRGAQSAYGALLVFLDDDLYPLPRLLEEHTRTQAQDRPGVVLGRVQPAGTGKRGGWNIWEERTLERHYRAVEDGRRPPAGRRLYSGNFSVLRDRFIQSGGFDVELERGEDVELGFRLEKTGLPFYYNPHAVVRHRGYRSFGSWCRSSYLYGSSDVLLATKRGHREVLSEIFRWYHHKPLVVRWMVRACLGRRVVRNSLLRALRIGSGVMSTLRFSRAANLGYSGIFNLQYWQGVSDELGGRKVFNQYAERLRPSKIAIGSSRPSAVETSGNGPATFDLNRQEMSREYHDTRVSGHIKKDSEGQ